MRIVKGHALFNKFSFNSFSFLIETNNFKDIDIKVAKSIIRLNVTNTHPPSSSLISIGSCLYNS